MMGNKKLSTIRQELKDAIKATGQDPIEWLEQRTARAKQQGDGTEVLESLRRVLTAGAKRKSRKRRVRADK
jgi:hypothetical protein